MEKSALVVLCFVAIVNVIESDKIVKLPGQPQVRFQQFSGYVTVDDYHNTSFFYYFVEAQTQPNSKPLVLWLNGGPGCSSVGVGAFSENGPFRPDGKLLLTNPYSWNTEANMLYLETPVGVGFSYSTNASSYVSVNDSNTARANLIFMLRWFKKFPHYKNTDLFLTGESYAGHYIPQLAKLMLQVNKKRKVFNLKGIALGNPVLEYATDFNSRAEYMWSHGLISDSTYTMFTSVCNYSRYVSEYYRDSLSDSCLKVITLVNQENSNFIDKYDVTLDVCVSSAFSQTKPINPKPQQQRTVPSQVSEKIDVCVDDKVEKYLNRRDVKMALHAKLVGVGKWQACSEVLEYEMLNLELPTISMVGSLVKSGISVLVYSGDQDSVIPLMGSRKLVEKVARELGLKTTVPYRVWFHRKQVGGWTKVYGKNALSYATIRGASHEAPFSQPQRSLTLFKSFLRSIPLPHSFTPH